MRPLRAIPGLASALLLSASCSTHKGPSIPLLFGDNADPTTGCAVSSGSQEDHLQGVDKLRVTLRSRKSDGSTLDFCDRVFDFPGTEPNLKLALDGAATVDVYVEAFSTSTDMGASGVRRVATGVLPGVAPSEASLGTMRLYPSEQFRCAPAQADFGRAFHTATLLPDGRVLFLGGLVTSASDAGQNVFTTVGATAATQAEIWDPRTQAATLVNDPTASADMGVGLDDAGTPYITAGRAFHSAALLSNAGPCPTGNDAILVVGGFSPSAPGAPIFAGVSSLGGSRLEPFGSSNGSTASPLSVRAAGNEVVCFDPAANSITHVPWPGTPVGFRAAAVAGSSFVVAGGIDYDPTMFNTVTFPTGNLDVFGLANSSHLTGNTANDRTGATLTMLPDGQGLLWGGNDYGDPIGELLGDLQAAPYGAPFDVLGATATQFHTATLLDDTPTPSVLVTGGFEVEQGGLDTQPPIAGNAVRVLSVSGGVVTQSTPPFGANADLPNTPSYSPDGACSEPTRYRPAGFESAISLDRGRVLISGGSPSTTLATSHCSDCPAGVSTLCAQGQASIYQGGQIFPASNMQVPRFGHTSTMLQDGTVLIAGGIGQVSTTGGTYSAVFLKDLEVYNPRTLTPPYDATMSTSIDTDDPIADVLAADMLTRAPAQQAVDPAHPAKPAKSCGTL